jgi:hypothetical protein
MTTGREMGRRDEQTVSGMDARENLRGRLALV